MDFDCINSKKMNFFKKYHFLLLLISTTCFVQFIKLFENKQLKKVKKNLMNKVIYFKKGLTLRIKIKEVSMKI